MKRSKGFTLIELLAVIVILAIIAIIVVPVVLKVIDDSRKKSEEISISSFGKAIEKTVGTMQTNPEYVNKDIKCEQDRNSLEVTCYVLNNNGEKIEESASIVEYSGRQIDTYRLECEILLKNYVKNNSIKKINSSCEALNMNTNGIYVDGKTGTVVLESVKVKGSHRRHTWINNTNTLYSYIIAKSQEENDDGIVIDDYDNKRYVGSNDDVKNYVYFNCSDPENTSTCEIWRIIGAFDGNVKLIKEDTINHSSWNNYGYHNSTIYQELQLYYSSISSSSKNLVQEKSYYFNRYWSLDSETSGRTLFTKLYIGEKTKDTEYSNDNVFNDAIGLMYASDYVFAGACTSVSTCNNKNYLYKKDKLPLYTLTSYKYNSYGIVVNTNSIGPLPTSSHMAYIKPVVYLKSSVKIKMGDGTENNPYQLSL